MALKRFTSILSGKKNPFDRRDRDSDLDDIEGDTPEANIARSIKLFCEAGNPESALAQGEEVLQLPVIVDAAESSPAAAAVAARHIRKFLSQQYNATQPHNQYNAIMLLRILADNPGLTFTRNVDSKFVSTVKEVLRNCRDPSVQQILRETLMTLYREKAYDTNLSNLFAMWQKESGIVGNTSGSSPTVVPGPMPAYNGIPPPPPRDGYRSSRNNHSRSLPAPSELSQRIEEARTSGKLLQQLVQSTPQAELQSNDLIKEFADRCQSAQRSMQTYLSADDPMPDDETMQTLIETSEQLSLALSKHSRALLQARRARASANPSPTPTPTPPPLPSRTNGLDLPGAAQTSATYAPSSGGFSPELSSYSPPPIPPPAAGPHREAIEPAYTGTYSPPALPPPTRKPIPVEEDPFADSHASAPFDEDQHNQPVVSATLGRPAIRNITSSYVRRQDDAEENLTMHGGRDSTPVSPQRSPELKRSSAGEVSPVEAKK